jgi:ABC-type microcin C transport system permease subunit YejE
MLSMHLKPSRCTLLYFLVVYGWPCLDISVRLNLLYVKAPNYTKL